MKKILGIAAVMALTVAGSFALDLGDIKGTWKDAKWDANWTFSECRCKRCKRFFQVCRNRTCIQIHKTTYIKCRSRHDS